MEPAEDPRLSPGTKQFLAALNGAGGPPLETLDPYAAREVLVKAQASVPVDYSGIEETQKQIETNGYAITLDLVRPAGANGTLPVFMFIHGGAGCLATIRPATVRYAAQRARARVGNSCNARADRCAARHQR